jgi:hypothetical protein
MTKFEPVPTDWPSSDLSRRRTPIRVQPAKLDLVPEQDTFKSPRSWDSDLSDDQVSFGDAIRVSITPYRRVSPPILRRKGILRLPESQSDNEEFYASSCYTGDSTPSPSEPGSDRETDSTPIPSEPSSVDEADAWTQCISRQYVDAQLCSRSS